MSSFLFKNANILDGCGGEVEDACIGIKNKKICWIQKSPSKMEIEKQGPWDEIFDAHNCIVMPGFYNAHAHVPMTLLRGRGENLALNDWLNQAIFPFEAYIDDEAAYWATLLGIAEMMRFGTVSFSDMYYNSSARAKAVLESGMKCNLSQAVVNTENDCEFESLPIYNTLVSLIRNYHKKEDGRLLIDASLHAEYTSSPLIAKGVAKFAQDFGLHMHVHVSETLKEVKECKERHQGKTPVQYLYDCGLFNSPTTAAHCVWLEDDDYSLLKEKSVTVACNPASNAKLGSGIANISELKNQGIQMALGTDGVASNNNHDMHRGMYLLALFQRAKTCNPVGLSSQELIKIATYNGAQSQGRCECGSLKIGNRADIVVFNIDTPWMQPIQSLSSNLVYSALGSDVILTMIDGKVVYRDGEFNTIDIEKAIDQTKRNRNKILEKLGEN